MELTEAILDFIITLVSAVINNSDRILAALGGAALTLIIQLTTNRLAIRNTTQLKLREKLLDKRLKAYDEILDLVFELNRSAILPYPHSKPFSTSKIPNSFISTEALAKFLDDFYEKGSTLSWLDLKTASVYRMIQEYLNLLLDFLDDAVEPLQTLNESEREHYEENITELTDTLLWEFGTILLTDFVGFSGMLEKHIFNYYNQGLESLRLSNPQKRHSWEIHSSNDRTTIQSFLKKFTLSQTQLCQEVEKIREIRDRYQLKSIKLRNNIRNSPQDLEQENTNHHPDQEHEPQEEERDNPL
jgi:hypothetical protein